MEASKGQSNSKQLQWKNYNDDSYNKTLLNSEEDSDDDDEDEDGDDDDEEDDEDGEGTKRRKKRKKGLCGSRKRRSRCIL